MLGISVGYCQPRFSGGRNNRERDSCFILGY